MHLETRDLIVQCPSPCKGGIIVHSRKEEGEIVEVMKQRFFNVVEAVRLVNVADEACYSLMLREHFCQFIGTNFLGTEIYLCTYSWEPGFSRELLFYCSLASGFLAYLISYQDSPNECL